MDHRLVVFCLFLVVLQLSNARWKRDRRPKVYGDRIPFQSLLPTRRKIQHKIVLFHNSFRARVEPKAANMLRMKWHSGAADAAQRWAEECMFLTHDGVIGRYIEDYGSCGQNIFVSSHRVPWLFAIKTWYLEKDNFTYGSNSNDLKVIGHYTQMVWAASHEVGCGISRCYTNTNFTGGIYYNYVCNYCPIGNRPAQLGRPYKTGKPCNLCKRHCHKNRLCTNACPFADLWINCKELYRYWPSWLCNSSSNQGEERASSCKATCNCKRRIHD